MYKLALIAFMAVAAAHSTFAMDIMANDHDRIAADLGRNCTAANSCEGVLYVSCQPELDGPTFYVDLATEAVISTCGGACWDRDDQSRCKRECPPPQWTCER